MTPDQWRQVTTVFHAALAHDQLARASFLEDACRGDAGVRAEVERLLAAHQDAGKFGEVPVVTDLGGSPPTAPTRTEPTADPSAMPREGPVVALCVRGGAQSGADSGASRQSPVLMSLMAVE
jgi:hypothetical protein